MKKILLILLTLIPISSLSFAAEFAALNNDTNIIDDSGESPSRT